MKGKIFKRLKELDNDLRFCLEHYDIDQENEYWTLRISSIQFGMSELYNLLSEKDKEEYMEELNESI